MSFYNQSIATQIIDPVFNSSKYRTEFRIVKDGLYLSNMRIHNLGLTTSTLGVADEVAYNYLTGIHGGIQNIYLYDGKVILDQVLNYGDRSAFTEYNKTNQANSDIYKFTSKTGLGFVLNREPQLDVQPTQQNKALVTEFYPNSTKDLGDTQEATALGFLNLREVFPMLKNVEFLHTAIFKNLRVVIEYKQNSNAVAYDGALSSSFAGTSQPILVVDQVMNESVAQKVLSEFKPIVWSAQELEQVFVPASSTAGLQQIKFRLNGFSNKTLTSLLIQKKGTTNISNLYKTFASESVVDEVMQILVDGANILPQNGVDRPMWRLSLLSDSFGNCNSHTSSSSLTTYLPANVIANTVKNTETVANWNDRAGRTDYFGCIINKPINTLDIQYTRTIDLGSNGRYRQALFLNVFGNVVKQITPAGKNGYTVSYVF
jgi:hypothetical protein